MQPLKVAIKLLQMHFEQWYTRSSLCASMQRKLHVRQNHEKNQFYAFNVTHAKYTFTFFLFGFSFSLNGECDDVCSHAVAIKPNEIGFISRNSSKLIELIHVFAFHSRAHAHEYSFRNMEIKNLFVHLIAGIQFAKRKHRIKPTSSTENEMLGPCVYGHLKWLE